MICLICSQRGRRHTCLAAPLPLKRRPEPDGRFYGPTQRKCADVVRPDGTCGNFIALAEVSNGVAVWPLVDVALRGRDR